MIAYAPKDGVTLIFLNSNQNVTKYLPYSLKFATLALEIELKSSNLTACLFLRNKETGSFFIIR